MDYSYIGRVRSEILPLWPGQCDRVLEIGCGAGMTLAYLKRSGLCRWTAGVELHRDAAARAREQIDLLLEASIEQLELPFDPNSFNVILCLDVLEHLADPWRVLTVLKRLLAPNGVIIASIPNVRHASVVLPLLLQGRWDYADTGLLDRTHLRFFTRRTAIELFESTGYHVDRVLPTGTERGRPGWLPNLLTLTLFKPLLELQYLIRAQAV
jgi:SAM-dependent methyltransferase